MSRMLCIDIGAVTQDILLFDAEEETLENNVKLVLPSPTLMYSRIVRDLTRSGRNIFFSGDTIGGGSIKHAVKNHILKGFTVYATPEAAYTFSNDIREIEEIGVKITKKTPLNSRWVEIRLREVFVEEILDFISNFGKAGRIDVIAVAVQDHGVPPTRMSNRAFRFKIYRDRLEEDNYVSSLAYLENEIPSYALRMKSVAKAIRRYSKEVKILLMDTSPVSILGCLENESISSKNRFLIINLGNAHTVAATIKDRQILGLFEHHTRMLTAEKLKKYLRKLVSGTLTHEEIFGDGGHGTIILDSIDNVDRLLVTGPQRSLIEETGLNFEYAAPLGDVMMTGPMGLVKAAKEKELI